jgi:UDP-N-acetylmuramoyl-L-alanyl-D-glutamate--2,6-diaminopimelate ligase
MVNEPQVEVGIEAIIARVAPLAVLGAPAGLAITDVAFDSRAVRPGALFCCLPGEHHDGHAFAAAARAAGAVAFLCEHSLGAEAFGALQLVVAPGTVRSAMAEAACAFYGDPAASMKTVGVTGTNGKTTTTYLLRSILEHEGWRTGVIGTLDGARTTPEAPDLQRGLARQRDAGCVASALEVSSHSLVQHRVDGFCFDVAVFTNLTQDHLDFHETMENYFAAKAELFTPAHARLAVVNADDAYGRRLIDRADIPVTTFSLEDARDLEIGVTMSRFRIGSRLVRFALGGEFNVRNALAAAAAAHELGVSVDSIVAGLEAAPAVPGRFEAIESDGVIVLVDYAHTPAGLEEVLRAARSALAFAPSTLHPTGSPESGGRVIAVFGCGGERDRGKRPAMGAVAAALADGVILTSDNPRSEDPLAIIGEIRAGMPARARVVVEPDRRTAINRALGEARPGDVVVVAGKGHETTQQFADHSIRFDDREVVRAEQARRGLIRRAGGDQLS